MTNDPTPQLGGGGRTMPQLLFVTHPQRLSDCIGIQEYSAILSIVTRAKMPLCLLPNGMSDAVSCTAYVQSVLGQCNKEQQISGVVILGGHFVVPSALKGTLDSHFRKEVERYAQGNNKAPDPNDNFIVWSDDGYGTLDGSSGLDFSPLNLPVSRIPSGNSYELMQRALTAHTKQNNINSVCLYSADFFHPRQIFLDSVPNSDSKYLWIYDDPQNCPHLPAQLSEQCGYIVLHGSPLSGSSLTGTNNTYLDIQQVKNSQLKVIQASSCWGAVLVNDTAYAASINQSLFTPRTPNDSVAFQFLYQGALAFVGCTAENYASTDKVFWNCLSAPLDVFFWKSLGQNMSPAQALLNAKRLYALRIQCGNKDILATAQEIKIMHSYTCLGLGW
jgi:hypothetical protein